MNSRVWYKLALGCTLLSLVTIIAAGCSNSEENKPVATDNTVQIPSVKVSQVENRSIGDPQETVAEVLASENRDIIAKASGDVLKVTKKRGDQVKKGELLIELDPTDVLLQKQKAEISLRTAQDNLKNGQFTSSNDPDALQPLKDQIQLAQISIQEIDRTLANYKITAPISGVLTDFPVEQGMTVSQGVVGNIQQIDPVKIEASITEENAKLLQGKNELTFYTTDQPEQLQKATIVYFSDIMNTQQRTYSVELEADNKGLALKPGAKIQLLLTDEAEQEVLTVPTTAVIREESNSFVYVYAEGKVEKRQVQLGRLNGMYQEVTSGLSQGDQIVISGQYQLKDQQEVDAVSAE
ncbi:efflux RND transporter periplasmic adaptor subunit [Paenibacillus sp. M1]|uniref:Efflux RND transporter periplasmic adaptor subunit n=1 Tax=Paenibacillus haidiansis TaxID=1574488 RepID=A0ABU7VYF4_9BACL